MPKQRREPTRNILAAIKAVLKTKGISFGGDAGVRDKLLETGKFPAAVDGTSFGEAVGNTAAAGV